MDLMTLLNEMDEGISDLHLIVGQPPIFRKSGQLIRREGEVLRADQLLEKLVLPHLDEHRRQLFLHDGVGVLATVVHEGRRFRMQVFRERGNVSATIRIVPNCVYTLEELGVPPIIAKFTQATRGLIFTTGPTGSGKTTLLAGMIEEINRSRAERILTLENPIEYVFESKESVITQQEMGTDFIDLPAALRDAFYADPDVVVISELKNLEVVHLALTLAETGHLVLAPLGSPSTSEAILRLIEAFPEAMRAEIRRQLSNHLQVVVAQCLVPRYQKPGRLPLHEILIATPQVRQLLREGATDFTPVLENSRDIGMQTMNDALLQAVESGEISQEMADQRRN